MKKLLKSRSILLRKKQTHTEKIFWNSLRNRRFSNYKFRRQYVIGRYIVDFVRIHKKLVIEIDGDTHLYRVQYDAKRTRYLESLGYQVVRITNEKVMSNADHALDVVFGALINDQTPSQ